MTRSIDAVDVHIMQELQSDASRSVAQIARIVGISNAPCFRRIRRLKDEGYISSITAVLDRQKNRVDAEVFVFVQLHKNDSLRIRQFAEVIKGCCEVVECYSLVGQMDFMLRVITRTMADYESFYNSRLSRLPNLQVLRALPTVSAPKMTRSLPINAESLL